jgi:putative intracellular protease/amidase
LRGRQATVWVGYENEEYKEMELSGARYTGESVTVDKRVITANGPEAATEFAAAIAKEL